MSALPRSASEVVFRSAMRLGSTWKHLCRDLRRLGVASEKRHLLEPFAELIAVFAAEAQPAEFLSTADAVDRASDDVQDMFALLSMLAGHGGHSQKTVEVPKKDLVPVQVPMITKHLQAKVDPFTTNDPWLPRRRGGKGGDGSFCGKGKGKEGEGKMSNDGEKLREENETKKADKESATKEVLDDRTMEVATKDATTEAGAAAAAEGCFKLVAGHPAAAEKLVIAAGKFVSPPLCGVPMQPPDTLSIDTDAVAKEAAHTPDATSIDLKEKEKAKDSDLQRILGALTQFKAEVEEDRVALRLCMSSCGAIFPSGDG